MYPVNSGQPFSYLELLLKAEQDYNVYGGTFFLFLFFFRYKSYPPEVLVDLVARILALVPPWTRVYRVQRDIPMPLVR